MRSETVARTLFADPWNPTKAEVLRWAYTKHASAPEQDFELAIIYNSDLHMTVLACAADEICPKQRFFLSCLYVLVGDAVRTSWDRFPKPVIERLIQQGGESGKPDIQLWATRTQELLNNPSSYTYADWGLGSRLAYAGVPTKSSKHKRKRSKS